jgi:hypothetical protein
MKVIKFKDMNRLIEYKGEFYTPQEMQEKFQINGDFEITINDGDDNWFGLAMQALQAEIEGKH